jgi:hypothetical protein
MSEDILGRLDHFIRRLSFLSELYSDSEPDDSPGDRYGYYLTLCDILYDLESIERAMRAKITQTQGTDQKKVLMITDI